MAISRLFLGALAGGIATVPMTAAMTFMHRRLPQHERYPLPPREITEEMTERTGLREHLDESDQRTTAVVTHYVYGAGVGMVYASLPSGYRSSPVWGGIAYGLAVWGVSYLGLLPGLGILRPATEHPTRRTALMIAAHAVWGSALGVLVEGGSRTENLDGGFPNRRVTDL